MTLNQLKKAIRPADLNHQTQNKYFFKMFDHDLGGPLYSEISEGNEIVPTFKGQVRVKID